MTTHGIGNPMEDTISDEKIQPWLPVLSRSYELIQTQLLLLIPKTANSHFGVSKLRH